jgi:hypothetical protein
MKYLLLIYSNPENWEHPIYRETSAFRALPAEERDVLDRQAEALGDELRASGELVAGMALADPSIARTVRVRSGVPAVTDGPYVEAKEQVAGFFVVECDSPERAAEIAARFPDASFAAVEVRPIVATSELA